MVTLLNANEHLAVAELSIAVIAYTACRQAASNCGFAAPRCCMKEDSCEQASYIATAQVLSRPDKQAHLAFDCMCSMSPPSAAHHYPAPLDSTAGDHRLLTECLNNLTRQVCL